MGRKSTASSVIDVDIALRQRRDLFFKKVYSYFRCNVLGGFKLHEAVWPEQSELLVFIALHAAKILDSFSCAIAEQIPGKLSCNSSGHLGLSLLKCFRPALNILSQRRTLLSPFAVGAIELIKLSIKSD